MYRIGVMLMPFTSRPRRVARVFVPIGLLLASAFVLFPRLDLPPACAAETALSGDVASFIQSEYVDHAGRRLPLFPEGASGNHYAPLPVYAGVIAAGATSPPSSFRIAAATIALTNVLLLYVVATQVFASVTLGAVSAGFLLVTPAHVTLGRSFTPDGIWHVPFVCAWLLSMAAIPRHREHAGWLLALATGSIAASIYSQPSAALMAVVLIALTIAALARCPLTWRDLGAGMAASAVIGLPLLVWLLQDPSAYADTFGQWFVHQAHLRSPRAWWMAASHPNLLTRFSEGYWDFFRPTHLWMSETAPGWTGAFLLPASVFAGIGAYAGLAAPTDARGSRAFTRLLLGGVASLPLAAALFMSATAMDRSLAIAPLVALLAASGAEWLWTSRSRRAVCIVLAAALVVQFAVWHVGTVAVPHRSDDPCATRP